MYEVDLVDLSELDLFHKVNEKISFNNDKNTNSKGFNERIHSFLNRNGIE